MKELAESLETTLFTAAQSGDVAGVSRALAQDSTLGRRYQGEMTALLCAAEVGGENGLACVRALLGHSDAQARCLDTEEGGGERKGQTALMIAAERGDTALVTLLMPYSESLAQDEWETTAFDYAVRSGVVSCMQACLAGCENEWEAKGESALRSEAFCRGLIASARNPEVTQWLLDHDPSGVREYGHKVLAVAAEKERLATFLLVLPKAELHEIPYFNSIFRKVMRPWLPRKGEGTSPERVAMARALLAIEPFPTADKDGQNALMWAAQAGALEIVQQLLPHAAYQKPDREGETALMKASALGHASCVQALLTQGDPKAQADGGQTALIMAVWGGYVDCVRILIPVSDLDAGADSGKSAFDCAMRQPKQGCADLLASGGSLERAQRLLHALTPLAQRDLPLTQAYVERGGLAQHLSEAKREKEAQATTGEERQVIVGDARGVESHPSQKLTGYEKESQGGERLTTVPARKAQRRL